MISAKVQAHDRLAYSTGEAAQLLGYSRGGFTALLDEGVIPSFKQGRKRLVRRADLLAFLDQAVRTQPQDERGAA